jgi:hypothetical protein
MNREVKHGKRSPSDTVPGAAPHTVNRPAFRLDSAVIVSATAFPLVRPDVVGATGFEPVTPSVSVNAGLPLC